MWRRLPIPCLAPRGDLHPPAIVCLVGQLDGDVGSEKSAGRENSPPQTRKPSRVRCCRALELQRVIVIIRQLGWRLRLGPRWPAPRRSPHHCPRAAHTVLQSEEQSRTSALPPQETSRSPAGGCLLPSDAAAGAQQRQHSCAWERPAPTFAMATPCCWRFARLRLLLAALALAAAHTCLGRSLQQRPGAAGDYDVVVVGAGMAGIAAARTLAEAGLRVLVLEGG